MKNLFLLNEAVRQFEFLAVFGTRDAAKGVFFKLLQQDVRVDCFCDSNRNNCTGTLMNKPILHIDELMDRRRTAAIVVCGSTATTVGAELASRGFEHIFYDLSSEMGHIHLERSAPSSPLPERLPHIGRRPLPDPEADLMYDFRLGYVRKGTDLPGFDYFEHPGEAPLRVLVLGGSVTAGQLRAGTAWPQLLFGRFQADDVPVRIWSADTEGYGAAQELMVLVRDGLLLRPDIVVSLSGFNDFRYRLGLDLSEQDAAILKKHPFTTPGQLAWLDEVLAGFSIQNQVLYFGEEDDRPVPDYWLGQMELMNTLCRGFGSRFIAFLQPCDFSGTHVPLRALYAETTKKAAGLDYFVDLSNLPEGGAGVAAAIYTHLTNPGIGQ